MAGIPDGYKDILQKKAFANLATVGTDGTPQVTPVWVDYDGTHIRFNTAKGRVKDQNLRRNPAVALSILDPDNPYRYLQVEGAWPRSPSRAPTPTSTRSPRSTSARTGIRTASPARCASSSRSRPTASRRWGRRGVIALDAVSKGYGGQPLLRRTARGASAGASASAWSGRTARARPRSAASSPASRSRTRGGCTATPASPSATCPRRSAPARTARCWRRRCPASTRSGASRPSSSRSRPAWPRPGRRARS